ncbi:hypothetical protein IFM89_008372 [Coptis chinensis]|uniref:Uncharacterized protein n=1 Tax=Coptis chinensis TaxID=261450 RepID=A0A835IKU5_9MAGN|nr:hypothetical protein IFM89_008372 [Coptis chinensis]
MTTSPPQANYDVITTTTDGPVMRFMNKRLRALKKKYNKILQIEEASSQGKPINKDQEEVLKTKPLILTLLDEYEKLHVTHVLIVVQEEVFLNNKPKEEKDDDDVVEKKVEKGGVSGANEIQEFHEVMV